jgi:hypothetical protein
MQVLVLGSQTGVVPTHWSLQASGVWHWPFTQVCPVKQHWLPQTVLAHAWQMPFWQNCPVGQHSDPQAWAVVQQVPLMQIWVPFVQQVVPQAVVPE